MKTKTEQAADVVRTQFSTTNLQRRVLSTVLVVAGALLVVFQQAEIDTWFDVYTHVILDPVALIGAVIAIVGPLLTSKPPSR